MNSPSHGTISPNLLRPVVQLLAEKGIPADGFLAPYALTRADILAGDGRIDVDVATRIVDDLAAALDDPCVGLSIARHVNYDALGVLGAVFVAGGTLGDVFALSCRFIDLVTDAVDAEYSRSERHVSLSLTPKPGMHVHPQGLLAAAAVVRDFVRARAAGLRPTKVIVRALDEASVRAASEYFECDVRVGDALALEYPAFAATQLLTGSDPSVAAAIERSLHARREPGRASTVAEVTRVIETLIAEGDPSLERAATLLGTSPRSLQRRLNGERTTWQRLVAETRKRLAEAHVREGELSLTEVAYRLGFADLSAFSKSFRKWFGVSATDFRNDARRRTRSAR